MLRAVHSSGETLMFNKPTWAKEDAKCEWCVVVYTYRWIYVDTHEHIQHIRILIIIPYTYRFPSTCLLERFDTVSSAEDWLHHKKTSHKQLKALAAQGVVDESMLQGQQVDDEKDKSSDTVSYIQLYKTTFALIVSYCLRNCSHTGQ